VVVTKAWAVVIESSSAAAVPLGLWPTLKETTDKSSVPMAGQVTSSVWFRSGQSNQSNSMIRMAFNLVSDFGIGHPLAAFQSMSDVAA